MKKLCLLLLTLSIMAACSWKPRITDESPASSDNTSRPVISDVAADAVGRYFVNGSSVADVLVEDLSEEKHFTCSTPEMINELIKQVGNQIYTQVDSLTEVTHKAEFKDPSGQLILLMEFGYNGVYFDRDVNIGDISIKQGTYDAAESPWASFTLYLNQLEHGYVMEPVDIKYPASIRILSQYYELKMIDRGNKRLNKYEVCPMKYDFVDRFVAGRDFVITEAKRYYDSMKLQSDKLDIMKEHQCLIVQFNSSDTRLEINTENDYHALAMAANITLAKLTDRSGEYALITDKMFFRIKPEEDFINGFDALFIENSGEFEEIQPDGILELFDSNMPYYVEYICSNLGISSWNGLAPQKIEVEEMVLDLEGVPHTVVNIYTPYDLRMLIYRPEGDESFRFIGNITFGGRSSEIDYELINATDEIWVKGESCRGSGTGVNMSHSDWYHLADGGMRLALSYPYDAHMDSPYGAYYVKATDTVINSTNVTRVQVAYDVTKRYYLFLDIADEYGAVELDGKKKVEFVWNSEEGLFEATVIEGGYGAEGEEGNNGIMNNENAIYYVDANCAEIDRKCDALLQEHYQQLSDNIDSIADVDNERRWRAQGIKTFLLDCSDCVEKDVLLQKLFIICPEIQDQ